MLQNQEKSWRQAAAHLLHDHRSKVVMTGLSGSDRALAVDRMYRERPMPMLVVLPSAKDAETFLENLRFFGGDAPVPALLFPPYNLSAFKSLAYHSETAARRIRALYLLVESSPPPVIVAPMAAVMQRLVPKSELVGYADLLQEGEEIDRENLVMRLINGGYNRSAIVEEPGDFCVRGAIVDIFSPRYEDPLRIEQFGDLVESIRFFSAATQRTLESIAEAVILPAREAIFSDDRLDEVTAAVRTRGAEQELPVGKIRSMVEEIRRMRTLSGVESLLPLIYPKTDTLFDYLPSGGIVIQVEPADLQAEAESAFGRIEKTYQSALAEGRLCVEPAQLYLQWELLCRRMADLPQLAIKALPVESREGQDGLRVDLDSRQNDTLREQIKARRDKERPFTPLAEWLDERKSEGQTTVMVCRTNSQADRLRALLTPYGHRPEIRAHFPEPALSPGGCCICIGRASGGFVWKELSLAVITEDEIFGPRQRRRTVRRPTVREQALAFEDLQQGDLVVHNEHGIGRYEGLIKLQLDGISNDFLLLTYRDEDKLYLPVDRMGQVQKYLGIEGVVPVLDRMGGKSWNRVKERVKKSTEKIAGELLRLYAARKVMPGFAHQIPGDLMDDFEAGFAYEETSDQVGAIEEVVRDMVAPHPMDRLICGDVGYGKTEVALRAAFLTAFNGKQTAVLVPTTVLAEQHYETFVQRFNPYPIKIACLSRFRPARTQQAIIEGLKNGAIDIVVGTHRLLQRDVGFKDLGLIVLDEEQRFGVKHKERLKRYRKTVDVLTLTATPIPRTLHLSMMGVRDISVISTPPEHRHPIVTYISEFNETVIREAVRKELDRGGQVFFVHNAVRSIERIAETVKRLVPEAKVDIAHAQLNEADLEAVMFRFVNREIDVLVCTTIIESGLDIPSANTIIVNRADRFGLAQMYQLRGRVGRSEEQAYAYLFIPTESTLSKDAQKRLKVLMEYSDLGAGFQIAMSDLKIRGGGTILGASQSGHISAVGYDMFLQLMEESIAEIKGEPLQRPLDPEINIDMSAFLPESYVPNIDQRLSAYRRLARFTELKEASDYKEELEDRFGPLPEAAANLLLKVMLRLLAIRSGVARLDLNHNRLHLAFSPEHVKSPAGLVALIENAGGRMRLSPDQVLTVDLVKRQRKAQMAEVKNVLKEIAGRANQ
jgi:transcription-repair coupling factor (superfamily II helicase)